MSSLIDTHAHIYDKRFRDDTEEMMSRAKEAGVTTVVVPATKPSDFEPMFSLAETYSEVKLAVGYHPHSAGDITDNDVTSLVEHTSKKDVVAIGEIGLDYYYDFSPRSRQQELFRHQLQIAKEHGLPAVIHNRESDDDVLDILSDEQDGSLRFQLHCFSSSIDVLHRALDLGGMISFTGNITFKKSTLSDVVKGVPLDRLMIETDAPYMTPVPYRGKRNEPAYVNCISEKIAEIREEPLEKISMMTTRNAQRFFGLTLLLLFALFSTPFTATAQEDSVRTETVEERPRYDKFVGIGGHLTSTTFIINRTTQATKVGFGGWLSLTPLQPAGIDWLALDIIYTATKVDNGIDDEWIDIRPSDDALPPQNTHNTLDVKLRFIPRSRNFINLYGSFGYTQFFNSYGVDEYIINELPETAEQINLTEFDESNWGLGASIGIAFNFETPAGIIHPMAEFHFSGIIGTRNLPRHDGSFILGQTRVGVLFYPKLGLL